MEGEEIEIRRKANGMRNCTAENIRNLCHVYTNAIFPIKNVSDWQFSKVVFCAWRKIPTLRSFPLSLTESSTPENKKISGISKSKI